MNEQILILINTFQNVDLTKDLSTRGLRMGACIHGSDNTNTYTGTLGGFVPINDSHLGFLTCAHVVGPEVGSLVSVVDPGNSMQRYLLISIMLS